jgi:hypothetical protein
MFLELLFNPEHGSSVFLRTVYKFLQESALDGGEWSSSRPGHFTPGTHWIGDCVGLRGGLDAVE